VTRLYQESKHELNIQTTSTHDKLRITVLGGIMRGMQYNRHAMNSRELQSLQGMSMIKTQPAFGIYNGRLTAKVQKILMVLIINMSCEFDTVVDDLNMNGTLLDDSSLQGNVIHHTIDCFPLLIFS